MLPETQYARSGDVHVAYQVSGDGPLDLVLVPGFVSHVEYQWEDPLTARFFERLASFSRLIRFDKRGTGLSDRVAGVPPLEERMDDIRAVMDAAGSERAAILGFSEGGQLSMMFAATYPERTSALLLVRIGRRRAPRRRLSLGPAARGSPGRAGLDGGRLGPDPWGVEIYAPTPGRRSGLPSLVDDVPAAGGQPRRGRRAAADERRSTTSARSCRRSASRP